MHAMNLDIGLAARVVAGIRSEVARRTGCKEWDTAGIAKALRETEGSPGDVLAAACLAAEDHKLERPSAAGFRICWPVNEVTQPKVSHDIPCPEHTGQTMPCPRCKADVRPPTEEEMAALMTKAKEAREYHAEMQRLQEQRKAAKG